MNKPTRIQHGMRPIQRGAFSLFGAISLILLLPAEGKFDLLMRDLIGGSDGNPNSTTEAETIMGLEESTGAYVFVDHQQSPDPSTINVAGGGNFGATNPLPNGKNGDNTYVLRAKANIIIPAGNWTVGFGSDDGGTLKIPGVNFTGRTNNNGSPASDEVRWENPRGHRWTFGTFTLAQPLETSLEAIMYESGGGDSWEIAIFSGHTTSFNKNTWSLLADGVLGWTVQVEPLNDPNPPVILTTSPEDNSTDNYQAANLVATFDEEIAPTGGGMITITDLSDGSDVRPMALPHPDVTISGNQLIIDPTGDLEYNTEYEVTISSGALEDTWDDPAPNVYGGTTSGEWTFRTAPYDPVGPDTASVFPFFPVAGAINVGLVFPYASAPSVLFDKPIVLGSGNVILRNLTVGEEYVIPATDTEQLIAGDDTYGPGLLTILPNVPLEPASDYAILIEPGAVLNRSGIPFGGISDINTWYFQTVTKTEFLNSNGLWADKNNWTFTIPRGRIDAEIRPASSAISDEGLADPYSGDLFLISGAALQIGDTSPHYQSDFNALGTPGETTIYMQTDSRLLFRSGNNNGSAPTDIPEIKLLGNAQVTMNEGSEPAEDFDFAHGINGPHRFTLRGNSGQDALLTAPNTFNRMVASDSGGTFNIRAQATGSLGGNITINSYNGGAAAFLFVEAPDAISDAAAVDLNGDTGTTLITMDADDTIDTLTINGFPYPAGTYGRIGTPGSVDNQVTWIAGNGILTIASDTGGSGGSIFLEISDNAIDSELFISNQSTIAYTLWFNKPGTFSGGPADFFSVGSANVIVDSVNQISDQEVRVVVTALTKGTINLQSNGSVSFTDLFSSTLNGPFVDDNTILMRDINDISSQLGRLNLSLNQGTNPATGKLWRIGDTYRLVFCSSTGTTATSSDINTYNTFVQNLANSSSLNIGAAEGVTWKAIASTPTIAANVNASMNPFEGGTSIWLVDGSTLVAEDYPDLYGGRKSMNNAISKSENGGQPLYAGRYRDVWTGSDVNGNIKSNDALGASDGNSKGGLISKEAWIDRFTINQSEVRPMYGISELLTVQSTLPPAPEIAIRRGLSDISDGISSQSFGTHDVGTSNDIEFTIYNFGDADLTLSGSPRVQVSSGHTGDFSIEQQPSSPVSPITGTTTFIVRFSPQAVGSRSATVSIINNDSDENPFTFTVTGTGTAQAGFDAWATGGESFDGDGNNDGVPDGIAFLLGAATPGTDARPLLPTASKSGNDLLLSFSCLPSSERGGANLFVQHSGDLGSGDSWTSVTVPDTSSGPTNGVSFSVTPGAGGLNDVTATIDDLEALNGKLFGRLLGSE